MNKANEMFQELLFLIRTLRGDGGCPWDKRQTVDTLKSYLQQEFQELMDALNKKASEEIQEEIGDLLFLLLFIAEVARDQGDFSIEDVLDTVKEKMIRRHPHIFGDLKTDDVFQIRKNWKKIKAREKLLHSRQSLMERIPRHLNPLLQAYWAIRKASEIGPDRNSPIKVVDQLAQEMEKLRGVVAQGNQRKARCQLGVLFLVLINLSLFFEVNPEKLIQESLNQFIQHFENTLQKT